MPARPPGGAGLPPACLLPACSRRLGLWWRAGTDRHQALSAHSDSVPARRAAKWRRWVPGWDICPAGFWAPSPCLYPTNVPLLCLKPAWRGTWRGGGGRGKRLSHVRITSSTTLLYFFGQFPLVWPSFRCRAFALRLGVGARRWAREEENAAVLLLDGPSSSCLALSRLFFPKVLQLRDQDNT